MISGTSHSSAFSPETRAWNRTCARAADAGAAIRIFDPRAGLAELTLTRPANGETEWTVRFR